MRSSVMGPVCGPPPTPPHVYGSGLAGSGGPVFRVPHNGVLVPQEASCRFSRPPSQWPWEMAIMLLLSVRKGINEERLE
jgi:hypothetical protein